MKPTRASVIRYLVNGGQRRKAATIYYTRVHLILQYGVRVDDECSCSTIEGGVHD